MPDRWRLALAAAAAVLALVPPTAAARCVEVGVYEDDPLTALGPLERAVGPLGAVQVYVGSGEAIDPALLERARTRRLRLVVAWVPTAVGTGPGRSPTSALAHGALDADLRALVASLRGLAMPPFLRPLPDPNAGWYPWGYGQRGSTSAGYRAAFRRVVRVVRAAPGGRRVRILWSPSGRSYPDEPANAIEGYFPGDGYVDAVGASIANVGDPGGRGWEGPAALLGAAYATIHALAPERPFWIAETASVEAGGDKAAWIWQLARLRRTLPRLAGLLWYDVADGIGDFRIRSSAASEAAFHNLLKGRC